MRLAGTPASRRPAIWVATAAASASSSAAGSSAGTALPGLAVAKGDLSREHEDGPLEYDTVPPVGGTHNPRWLACDVYDEPVPAEQAVHSLEHGAVWITYRPDLPADQLEVLTEQAASNNYVLVSPYEGLPSPIVMSAWGLQLQLEDASDHRLPVFVAKYANGDQTPEPGAPCSGGVGTPE